MMCKTSFGSDYLWESGHFHCANKITQGHLDAYSSPNAIVYHSLHLSQSPISLSLVIRYYLSRLTDDETSIELAWSLATDISLSLSLFFFFLSLANLILSRVVDNDPDSSSQMAEQHLQKPSFLASMFGRIYVGRSSILIRLGPSWMPLLIHEIWLVCAQ